MSLSKLFGSAVACRPAASLKGVLDGYPVYDEPYPGGHAGRSLSELRANLAYLLETKSNRQDELSKRLTGEGIDLSPIHDPDSDPLPSFGRMGRWLADGAAADYGPGRTDLDVYSDEIDRRDGNLIVFSLIKDISILIGDAVIVRRPASHRGLWLDPSDRPMPQYKHCSVLGLRVEGFDPATPACLTTEDFVLHRGFKERQSNARESNWAVKLHAQMGGYFPPPLPDDMLPVDWPDEELWAERTARDPSLTIDETSGLFTYDEDGNQIEPG